MSFKLHFMILNRSGPGDAQMSSLFQAHLRGNDFAQSPLEIAYGSKLTLKNYGYGGGLLHSHVQTYPVGSLQQQVTCYHYKDDNNNFYIYPPWGGKPVDPDAELEYVRDGDVLRIVHVPTTRNIHSHTVPAPMTKENYEVSAYGNLTVGDVHDHWVVEVVDDMILGKKKNVDKIHALTTRMRFRHQVLGCYLKAANVPLPQWGWKQIEVTCDKQNNPADAHTWWNVESHWNDRRKRAIVEQIMSYWTLIHYLKFDSTLGRCQTIQVAILERLLAPQRGHDDLEQRAHSRSRQGRYLGFATARLALVAPGTSYVRLGRQSDQVLSAWDTHYLVGRRCGLDCRLSHARDLLDADAKTVQGLGRR
jgi:dolichyl-phosphate-mannose--protein O-mannosyl transferase